MTSPVPRPGRSPGRSTSRRLRPLLAALAAALALGGGAAYWLLRKPTAPRGGAPAAVSATPAPLSASQVERGIESARARAERDPQDANAWAMLAKSHEMVGRFDDAAKAYDKLLALRPQDAQVHADYADALGVVSKGSLQGEPARLIARALELDPANFKALVLAGKEAFERKRWAEAVAHWERALARTQDGAVRRPIETSIAEAQALQSPGRGSSKAAGGLAFVSGRVTVSAALRERIAADDSVFVFARPASGSRMPVALLRKRGADLPLDFALDDSLSMVPEARLSQHRTLMLGVRVSRRGDAIPAAGDLEGELGPVALGSTGHALEISRVRP